MTIKELAYSAQQQLQNSTGSSLKRAHIYELLAASFGFNTYAAFGVDTVFAQKRPDDEHIVSRDTFVGQRLIALGYPPESAGLVSAALRTFLEERHVGIVRISALISQLREEWSGPGNYPPAGVDTEQFDEEEDVRPAAQWLGSDDTKEGFAPLMLDGLEAAASKGNSAAHYALALILAPDEDDTDHVGGSSYWHSQAQQGLVLSGVKKEWADAYAAQLEKADRYAFHLREAGRLGDQHALLDLAERFGDPSFFEQLHCDVDAAPSAVAEIAERLGRVTDAKRWLTVAAEGGDTDAMLRLIAEYDRSDLVQCWIWVHLSRLVGNDLSEDAHYAIHEDGSDYDDEVGGPAYVEGRDSVNLDPLDPEQNTAAKSAAQDLFDQIQQAAAAELRR